MCLSGTRGCIAVTHAKSILSLRRLARKERLLSSFVVHCLFRGAKRSDRLRRDKGVLIRFSVLRLGRTCRGSIEGRLFKRAVQVRSVRSALLCLSQVRTLRVRNNFLILCGQLRVSELILGGGVRCGRSSCRGLRLFCTGGVRRVGVINRCMQGVLSNGDSTLRFISSCFRLGCSSFLRGCFPNGQESRVGQGVAGAGLRQLLKGLSRARLRVIGSSHPNSVIIVTKPKDKGAHMLIRGLTCLLLRRSIGRRRLLVLAFSHTTTDRFEQQL